MPTNYNLNKNLNKQKNIKKVEKRIYVQKLGCFLQNIFKVTFLF